VVLRCSPMAGATFQGRNREMKRAPMLWIGALVACAAAAVVALTGLPGKLLNAPDGATQEQTAVTATTAAINRSVPISGPIATVAALATAMVSPRTSGPVVLTAAPEVVAPQPWTSTPAPEQPQPTPAPWPPPNTARTIFDEQWNAPHRWRDAPESTAWYTSAGGYLLFARDAGRFAALAAPVETPLADVVVSSTLRKMAGPPGGGYGLIVRDPGPGPRDGLNQIGNYYVLAVGVRGEFGIWRREGDHWIDLVPWTPTEAVHTGDSQNQLVVRAEGAKLTFLANGINLAEQTDTSPAAGMVGLFVGGDMNQVQVEHFSVQVLE